MEDLLAEVKFSPNNFEIIKQGNHVVCAISKKKIPLDKLSYWNVDLQEAYFSSKEAQTRHEQLNKS